MGKSRKQRTLQGTLETTRRRDNNVNNFINTIIFRDRGDHPDALHWRPDCYVKSSQPRRRKWNILQNTRLQSTCWLVLYITGYCNLWHTYESTHCIQHRPSVQSLATKVPLVIQPSTAHLILISVRRGLKPSHPAPWSILTLPSSELDIPDFYPRSQPCHPLGIISKELHLKSELFSLVITFRRLVLVILLRFTRIFDFPGQLLKHIYKAILENRQEKTSLFYQCSSSVFSLLWYFEGDLSLDQ